MSYSPSGMPSESSEPSDSPTSSPSNSPTVSQEPSGMPSVSSEPSVSSAPTPSPTPNPTTPPPTLSPQPTSEAGSESSPPTAVSIPSTSRPTVVLITTPDPTMMMTPRPTLPDDPVSATTTPPSDISSVESTTAPPSDESSMGPTTPQPTEMEQKTDIIVEDARLVQSPVEGYLSKGLGQCLGLDPDPDPLNNFYIGIQQANTDTAQQCAWSCQDCYCGVTENTGVVYVGFEYYESQDTCVCLFNAKKFGVFDGKLKDEPEDPLTFEDLNRIYRGCGQATDIRLPNGTLIEPVDSPDPVSSTGAASPQVLKAEGFGDKYVCYSVRRLPVEQRSKKYCSYHIMLFAPMFLNSTLISNLTQFVVCQLPLFIPADWRRVPWVY